MAHSQEKDPESFVIVPDSMNDDFSMLPILQKMPIAFQEAPEKIHLTEEDQKLLNQNLKELHLKSTESTEFTIDDDIESKVMDLLAENQTLKNTLQQNNLAMRQQVETLSNWQKEVFEVHESHKVKFEETKELIKNLKAENFELTKRLSSNSVSEPNQDYENVKRENEFLQVQIKKMSQELQNSMMTQVELVNQFRQLQMKIQVLESGPNPGVPVDENKLQIAQKQLEIAEMQIMQLTQQIESQNKELNTLKQEIQIEQESADVLKIQLDVYQSDFNAEREAREKIVGEKELLAEDLRDLQMRNERLLKEIEQLKRGGN